MDFHRRLRELRIASGLTQEELAHACGWQGQSRIANYESRGVSARQPKLDELALLAKALGVSIAQLLGESEAETFSALTVPANEIPAGYVRFQLLEGGGGMGAGVENQDYPEVIREVDIAEWEVRRKLGFLPPPGRIQLITGRGPSMRPRIDHGDVVMVDTSVRYFDGDAIYVISLGGETQIKMLQMRGDGIYVVSVNPDYPAYRIADSDSLHVGGKVVSALGFKEL